MALTFQVTFDCANPHVLAEWWAETLGWEVEPQDEAFIRRMVTEGHAEESETLEYRGSLVWRAGCAIVAPEGAPPGTPRVLFQLVPEPKAGKNRVHLDLRTGDADADEIRARLVQRGATVLHTGQQGPHRWVTMTDPEGNEFCI